MNTPVIFNHSAAIDDFVSTAVLSRMPNIDIKGIIVTNADCITTPAMNTTSRVNQFLGLTAQGIPLALSNARGYNAFPWAYRQDCFRMGTIEILEPYTSAVSPPYNDGEQLIQQLLQEAINTSNPVIFLATGPIAALTNVLEENPTLIDGIQKVVWMGGAVNVPGNLDPKTVPVEIANTKAEWNAFWDPFSITSMFSLFSGVHIFPLDITDQAKITPDFKSQLANQALNYNLSAFVSQAYELVADEPFYEMWNTLTTCFLGEDSFTIFNTPQSINLTIDEWGNDTQGWIHQQYGNNAQWVYQSMKDANAFYQYVLTIVQVNV